MGPGLPSAALRGARGSHLEGRLVALGVDACRGAPGAVRIARELVRLGAEVQPLAGPGIEAWVHPDALEYATGRPVRTWADPARRFDAVVLAPAGQGLLGKLARGVADSAPAAVALAHLGAAPVLAALAAGAEGEDSTVVASLPPAVRILGAGFDPHGEPRPEALAARVAGALCASPLRGRSVLVVGGGAFEPLDAMRVVATRGDAVLARALRLELQRRGARVHALLGPSASPHARDERAYETGRDLVALAALAGPHDLALVEEGLPQWAPVEQVGKIPSGQAGLVLQLHRAPDVVAKVRALVPHLLTYPVHATGAAEAQARVLADAAERTFLTRPGMGPP